MNPYLSFVKRIEAGVDQAKGLSVSGSMAPINSADKVVLFSPHPDDESITGLLPLRLMREAGMQIINVPVTFGSDPARQADRLNELNAACAYVGWEIFRGVDHLLELNASDIVRILERFQPKHILMPHAQDWNSRHISTHYLVKDALEQMPADFSCRIIETEFWSAMDDPNLMVEADAETVADLVAATSLHVGEVARNPYHLMLPAWMQDNVRRGGELIGGQGGTVPGFSFATLYRLRKWENGSFKNLFEDGKVISINTDALREVL